MESAVILAAAGRGLRMQEQINKQYLALKGHPILYHSLAACVAAGCFTQFIVVVTPGEETMFRRGVLLPFFSDLKLHIVSGGKERQDSVYNGLQAVGDSCEYVCVHDGARPLSRPLLFNRVLQAAAGKGAAIAAVPVKDTIKRVGAAKNVLETSPRENLWSVQTPQCFRRDWLQDAYDRAIKDNFYSTDDASLLEHYGYPVQVVEGDFQNIKITTPDDLILAEALLGRR